MAAYNKVNGTWSSENVELQTKILREQWGQRSHVDWGATHSTAQRSTRPGDGNARGTYYTQLTAAIGAGQVNGHSRRGRPARVVQMIGWAGSASLGTMAGRSRARRRRA
jgi:beta-glucosidase